VNQRLNHCFYNLFAKSTDNLLIQLIRYAFVGGAAFVVDFGLLFFLTSYCGLFYQVSACISFIAGLTVNYLISISWVFNKRRMHNKMLGEFLLFALVGVIGLGLNALIMYLFTDIIGLFYLLSKIISTIIVFGWNFLGRRYLSNH
jgi:putative flippase GtrA